MEEQRENLECFCSTASSHASAFPSMLWSTQPGGGEELTMTSLVRKGTCILFTLAYNKYMIKYLQKDQVPKLKPK